jgi:hypothetical protein
MVETDSSSDEPKTEIEVLNQRQHEHETQDEKPAEESR